tara:strand:- start:962 stop:1144 length:183 start_codon:yes stop_codon:yes gene_type:complete
MVCALPWMARHDLSGGYRRWQILLKKSELAPIGLRWFWFVDFGQCSLTTFATAFGGFGWF